MMHGGSCDGVWHDVSIQCGCTVCDKARSDYRLVSIAEKDAYRVKPSSIGVVHRLV